MKERIILLEKSKKILISTLITHVCSYVSPLQAVEWNPYEPIRYVKSPSELRASVSLPVLEKSLTIKPEKIQLMKRLKLAETDSRVEAISLSIPDDEEKLQEYAKKIAKPNRSLELAEYLRKKMELRVTKDPKSLEAKIQLDSKTSALINIDQIREQYAKSTRDVDVVTDPSDPYLSKQFAKLLRQAAFILPPEQLHEAKKHWQEQDTLSVKKDFLPPFSQEMFGKFTVFKGPNCFHASLAFHDSAIARSPFVNVKRENQYHPFMLNHDELLRAIDLYFYEVDTSKSPLKFGDLIIFYDVESELRATPDYRWMKHATSYLFGAYTFSKGSKSADTPYAIKTIEDEWNTWSKFSKNLGVKVYRRSQKSVTTRPPANLQDWLY